MAVMVVRVRRLYLIRSSMEISALSDDVLSLRS